MKATSIFFILAFLSIPLRAQAPLSDEKPLTEIKELLAQEKYQEVIRIAETEVSRSADLNYCYGTALARLERWDEAAKVFQRGLGQQPRDERFLLELAGVAFKQKKYSEAAVYLRRALRREVGDSEYAYANDFLASVYFLQGNLEAALSRWNRISKPMIEETPIEPALKVDPALLDHAFAFAPSSALSLPDLQTSMARVESLNIFSNYRFDLEARTDGKFDLVFRARERNGMGESKWESLLSLFRGVPFKTIQPEFYNIRGKAINFESLLRWDSEKRRVKSTFSFSRDPKWRYQLDLDLRDENWDIRRAFNGPSPSLGSLKLRKQALAASATSFVNGRLQWTTGVELSHRDFRGVSEALALNPTLQSEGFELKHQLSFKYELIRAPEKRFTLSSGAKNELGRVWSQPSQIFGKLQGSIAAHWFPQASGDDFEMSSKVRAGKTFGETPFDELFILGVERDNDLLMRAHIGTRNGRKGSAPLGRDYILSNWELDKIVYSNALIGLKLGPFLDSGRITDSSAALGSRTWLWDLGAQAKVRVLGVGVAFSYGKDLRTGKNAFYVSMFR